jgi:hypothetical protein
MGSGPVKKIEGPLAGLVFLADDDQPLARGAVVSTRHVREPAVPHVQKISSDSWPLLGVLFTVVSREV